MSGARSSTSASAIVPFERRLDSSPNKLVVARRAPVGGGRVQAAIGRGLSRRPVHRFQHIVSARLLSTTAIVRRSLSRFSSSPHLWMRTVRIHSLTKNAPASIVWIHTVRIDVYASLGSISKRNSRSSLEFTAAFVRLRMLSPGEHATCLIGFGTCRGGIGEKRIASHRIQGCLAAPVPQYRRADGRLD